MRKQHTPEERLAFKAKVEQAQEQMLTDLAENWRRKPEDLAEYLPQVKASTLLVWGSADTETPLWMGQKMEKEIPDAGLVVFEGRSHFAFLEEAQRFLVIVNTFLFGGNNA